MPTDKELMQQALDALEAMQSYAAAEKKGLRICDEAIEALRARLAQPEQEPVAWITDGGKGELWWHQSVKFDDDGNLIGENPDDIPLYTAPPHFLDPAKVARLMDEAFERGKKEVDMEQVKDIAQKLADCAVLNSAPPQREWMERERAVGYREGHQAALKQREWQGLTDEEVESLDCTTVNACDWNEYEVYKPSVQEFARAIEAKLKEKNT